MIALKTNHMMSTEILSFDSALLSPPDQSCYSDHGCLQTQHNTEVTQLASDQWLQDFEDIRRFCDGFDLDLPYDPELEAMTKEVGAQYQSKEVEIVDYLDSTAFLSPESIEPLSPPQSAVQDTGIDSEAAISLLEEILVANTDSNSFAEHTIPYDELTIPSASEDSASEVSVASEIPPLIQGRPKRQIKRKINDSDLEPIAKPKPKRSKTSADNKRERKRSQNKFAANRYRQKKRAEMDDMEKEFHDAEDTNAQLKAQLQKLQMEFKVVYPLAKAAFASDPNRSLQLQMLDIRVLNEELLENYI